VLFFFRKPEEASLMSCDTSIQVQHLSKCYLIYDHPKDRLKQYTLPRLRRWVGLQPKKYYREFWALNDVSFDVPKGETVGIIGRNGSGKSTLLQMICGTLSPTTGEVNTRGRVAALLELGSGFNPEFSGLENIYMNAAVLGMSEAETTEKLDEIIAFADIGDHLNQPTKTYSSGMAVRLAFAVQALSDPDILIVDEALAVGDIKFQAKCFERLKQLKNRGTSILLVTHSSEQIVTHCTSAILIEQGRIHTKGHPKDVINTYHDLVFGRKAGAPPPEPIQREPGSTEQSSLRSNLSVTEDLFSSHPGYNPHEYRWGDGKAKILDYALVTHSAHYPEHMDTGSTVQLQIAIRFLQDVKNPILGITIKTHEGVAVYGTNSEKQNTLAITGAGLAGQTMIAESRFTCHLAPGNYFISIGLASRDGDEVVPHDRRYDAIHFQVDPHLEFFGLTNLNMELTVPDLRT
jgi:lipopolysaccharide transport system ATP-binding protein